MAATAPQQPPIAPGEPRNVSISFLGVLDDGELLASIAEEDVTITPSGSLEASSIAVNSSALVINGVTHAAGQAVTMHVTGASASVTSYSIVAQPTTDSSPAQRPKGKIIIPVRDV